MTSTTEVQTSMFRQVEKKRLLFRDLDLIKSTISVLCDRTGIPHHTGQGGVISMTIALLKGLGTVLRLHHCPKELRLLFYRGASKFLLQEEIYSRNEVEKWVQLAKWFLTFPLAKYLGNEEPKRPDCVPPFFRPRFYRWMNCRFKKFSQKNTFFFTSWLQAKRACEPLTDDCIIGAFRKHREGMETVDPLSREVLDKIFKHGTNFTRLLSLVRKRLHKIFSMRTEKMSCHASFECTRARRGQRGAILRTIVSPFGEYECLGENGRTEIGGPWSYLSENWPFTCKKDEDPEDAMERQCPRDQFRETSYLLFTSLSDLVSMDYSPHAIIGPRKVSNVTFEKRTVFGFDLVPNLLEEEYHNLDEFSGLPSCIAAPVLEPLKIRMITAGPAGLYHPLKGLQMDLHAVLRRLPLFRLIGRVQNSTDLSDLVICDRLRVMKEPRWLSADYKSATDNLSTCLGQKILDYIVQDLPIRIQDYARRALGPHHISYPTIMNFDEDTRKVIMRKVPDVDQTNGQLMGGIMSFPILCLANAAALDRYQCETAQRLSFKEYLKSALINGDDLVTIVDGDEQLRRFKDISAEFGLDLTVGKSYIHPTYANINSTSYHYNLVALQAYLTTSDGTNLVRDRYGGMLPTPTLVEYFNTGLYFEQHKVQERVGGGTLNEDDEGLPEFSTDIVDPIVWTDHISDLPSGARKVLHRLREKGFNIPLEGHRPLYSISNRIINGTPDRYKAMVMCDLSHRISEYGEDIFLYQRADDRRGRWRWARRNHFLPQSAGGLGIGLDVSPKIKKRFYISSNQRRLAKHLYEQRVACGYVVDTSLPTRSRRRPPLIKRDVIPVSGSSEDILPFTGSYVLGKSDRFRISPQLISGGSPILC